MIDLIPAIDIINGSCVRLVEGDFARKTDYGHDPVEMARSFEKAGFKRLHVVDLDGARSGCPVHIPLLKNIANGSNLHIDFGGGVRDESQVEEILDAGAKQVSIGSIAVKDSEKVAGWIKKYGSDVFFLGADIKNDKIATNAWSQTSEYSVDEFITAWVEKGINRFFCTDVSRDGKLQGPAIELYTRIKKKYPKIYLVASGGVSRVRDIQDLEDAGIDAVIFGKAFYEGKITIDELIKWI